jgi:hypothetical protein
MVELVESGEVEKQRIVLLQVFPFIIEFRVAWLQIERTHGHNQPKFDEKVKGRLNFSQLSNTITRYENALVVNSRQNQVLYSD